MIASIRKTRNETERMRATIALARSIPVSQFADWLDAGYFSFRNGPELAVFRGILEARWKSEDPGGFAAWRLEHNRRSGATPDGATGAPDSETLAILSRWASEDPQRLSNWLARHPDKELMESLVLQLASDNPSLAALLLGEFAADRSNFLGNRFLGAIRQLAKRSPDALESVLPTLPPRPRFEAETAIARQRFDTNFGEELRRLANRPDGWRILAACLPDRFDKPFSAQLAAALPRLPEQWRNQLFFKLQRSTLLASAPESWFHADFSGFTPKQTETIQTRALKSIAGRNPEMAAELLDGSALSEPSRRRILERLCYHTARHPEESAQWFAMIESESERQFVLETFAKIDSNPNNALPRPKTAEEWFDFLLSKQWPSHRKYETIRSLPIFNSEQNAAFLGEFAKLPDEQKSEVAGLVVGSRASVLDHSPALATALVDQLLHHPPPNGLSAGFSKIVTRTASAAACRMVARDAPSACRWTASLPDGEIKLLTQQNMAAAWSETDPPAMRQWLSTLPPLPRKKIEAFLERQSFLSHLRAKSSITTKKP
jgi:hypothetical protein